MKRVFQLLLSLAMTLTMLSPTVFAKDNSLKVRQYKREQDALYTTLTFLYVDDTIWMQMAENIIYYDDLDVSSKEEAQEFLQDALGDTIDEYNAQEGVYYYLNYEANCVVENISVDYTKADLKKLELVEGFEDTTEKIYVSMEKTGKSLEKENYKLDGEYDGRIFINDGKDVESVLAFYCDGDRVAVQTAENTMYYDDLNVSDAQQAQDQFGPTFDEYAAQYEGVKGVHYTIVYQDDSLVEEISVDYNQVDMDDVKNIEGFNFNGSQDADYISMKKTLETLESSGYREVPDFSFVLE